MFGIDHKDTQKLIEKMHAKHRIRVSSCAICRGKAVKKLWSSGGVFPVKTVMCQDCGTVRNTETLPFEDLEIIGKHGGSLVHGLKMNTELSEEYFQKQKQRYAILLDYFSSQLPDLAGAHVLDMICEVGGGLEVLKSRGAMGLGLELSSDQGRYGREVKGLDICKQHILEYQSDQKFDLIIGLRFINHFHDPLSVMQKVRSLLKDDGCLLLETMNFKHAIRRKDLGKIIKIDHPYLFTDQTLPQLLKKAGFTLIHHSTDYDRGGKFGSLNHMHTLAKPIADDEASAVDLTINVEDEFHELLVALLNYVSLSVGKIEDNQRIKENSKLRLLLGRIGF